MDTLQMLVNITKTDEDK